MRIAFLTVEFVTENNQLAGAANFLARAVLAMHQLGHEPEVFTWSSEDGTTTWRGIPVHRVSWHRGIRHRIANKLSFGRFDHPLLIVQMARRMARRLGDRHRRRPFDAVHASGSGCTAFASTRMGLPTVVRFSGYQPECSRMLASRVTLADRIIHRLEVAAAKRAGACYAPSRLVAELYRKNFGLEMDVIEPCFQLDVSESAFDPSIAATLPTPYCLYFGPLSYLKGVDILAKSLRRVFGEHPGVTAVFVGPDRMDNGRKASDRIRQTIGSEHLKRCCFVEPLPHAQLYPVVCRAACVAIPSRIDNLPNTCLEAMALGQVVVGTRGSSLEQLIDDESSGFLVPREDPESLAGTILKALHLSPSARAGIGARARARIAQMAPERSVPRLVEYQRRAIATALIRDPRHGNGRAIATATSHRTS